MAKRTLILTIATFFLFASAVVIIKKYLQNKEIPDGGPCSNEEEYFPARIIGLDVFMPDSSEMDLTFEISYDGLLDTIKFIETNDGYYNAKTNSFKPDTGQIVRYVHQYITEGTCSPDFFYIEMRPFTQAR